MRRTKEEAALTRDAIVEAALHCFDEQGIAQSTLDGIAARAGVTKGAIYHHFNGKDEIFHEIRERVSLPLLDTADTTLLSGGARPALARIEAFLLGFVHTLDNDARTRKALGVMHFKCEYVGDRRSELPGMLQKFQYLLVAFEGAYREARKTGELRAGIAPDLAALETSLFLNGLVRLWLLDATANGLRRRARAAIRAHMGLRRCDKPAKRRGGVGAARAVRRAP
jgi:TetR/AcrR family acrAB operon transcriptional repressor